MFDGRLTQEALEYLQYAVVFYVSVGYWMLSNKQIFSNDLQPKFKESDVIKTGDPIC